VDLDPRQTTAVRAVIETGSFEQAAARLNITSSAVSQRVRALETRLGSPLIVRTRPCRATQMGQRLLQYLRRAALLEDDFASDLAGANEALLNVAAAVHVVFPRARRDPSAGKRPAGSDRRRSGPHLRAARLRSRDRLHYDRTGTHARLFRGTARRDALPAGGVACVRRALVSEWPDA
jgi:molybdenum-dependent DNA-binding transcriptional regulator ModE